MSNQKITSDKKRMLRIIVYRPGAFGDALVTLPALAMAAEMADVERITVIANPRLAPIFRRLIPLNGLDKIRIFDQSDSRFLHFFSPPPSRTGDLNALYEDFHRPTRIICFTKQFPALADAWHDRVVWEQVQPPAIETHCSPHASVRLATAIIGRDDISFDEIIDMAARFRWMANENDFSDVNYFEAGTHAIPPDNACVIHTGAGSPDKCLPLTILHQIAQRVENACGVPVVMLAGPAEADRNRDALLELPRVMISPSPGFLASWLTTQRTFAGADSGPGHLAALCGLPTVTWFTVADPLVWRPISNRSTVLDYRHGPLDADRISSDVFNAIAAILATR